MKDVRPLGIAGHRAAGIFSDFTEERKILGTTSTSTTHKKATQRHADIRENKRPSLGKIQVKVPHQRSPYAMKFEERSQEEIERQERCARGNMEIGQDYLRAQRNGQSYLLLTFQRMEFTSSIRKKTGGKRVSCRLRREHAHVEQERPELCRIGNRKKVSQNPTTVVTANGEVQTKEEATVYVKELDLIVTVMLLEGTLAFLSLGKFCEDHGYSYHWTSGQKPQLIKNGRRTECNTANHVPFVVPGLSTSSSSSSSPTSPTSSSQEAVTPWEHPAPTRSGSMGEEVGGDSSREYVTGCNAGEKHRRSLERWWGPRLVRYVDRVHKVHDIG